MRPVVEIKTDKILAMVPDHYDSEAVKEKLRHLKGTKWTLGDPVSEDARAAWMDYLEETDYDNPDRRGATAYLDGGAVKVTSRPSPR